MVNKRIYKLLARNCMTLTGEKVKPKKVNYEYWAEQDNVGDYLSNIVYEYMLERRGLDRDSPAVKTCHLLGIGSIVAAKQFDAVIWGSGLHTLIRLYLLYRWKKIVRYDVRALRGPLTKEAMVRCGYSCNSVVLGDPAVLMPLVYHPGNKEKKYDISIICHYSIQNLKRDSEYHYIDVQTKDYKYFIDEVMASKLIISSSLHGIILAESYGVPAVFLNDGGKMYPEIMKYYDWYYATNRNTVVMALSIEEACNMVPMDLPDLEQMRKNLIHCFPYDLWR